MAITEVGAKPVTLPLFALKHPRMAASFPRTLPGLVSPHSFAEATFYPIHAYGWVAADGTKSWVRYRLVLRRPRPIGSRRSSRARTGCPRRSGHAWPAGP